MRQSIIKYLNVDWLMTDKGSNSRIGRWGAALAVGALTACGMLAFAVPAHNSHTERSSSIGRAEIAKAAIRPAPALAGVPTARVQTEIINILPDGFEPSQITRSQGRVFLLVENHSGLSEVALQLDCEAGTRLLEVHVPREKLGWSDLFDLTPGRYVLTEANHPDWVCNVTITAH